MILLITICASEQIFKKFSEQAERETFKITFLVLFLHLHRKIKFLESETETFEVDVEECKRTHVE